MPAASMLRAGLRKQGSRTMDSHLLVVSGISSCWRSGCSEAEMNPSEGVAIRRVTSRLFSDGYHNKDNQQILRTHQYRI